MKAIALLLVSLFASASMADVVCKSYVRSMNGEGQVVVERTELKKTFDSPIQYRLEGQIKHVHFELQGDKKSDEFLIMISEGPDYTKGVIARASFDANGQLNLGRVNGSTVFKVECKR